MPDNYSYSPEMAKKKAALGATRAALYGPEPDFSASAAAAAAKKGVSAQGLSELADRKALLSKYNFGHGSSYTEPSSLGTINVGGSGGGDYPAKVMSLTSGYGQALLDAFSGQGGGQEQFNFDTQQGIDMRQGLMNEIMGLLQGYGGQAREDIMQRGQALESRGMQDLVSSGLAGTTVAPTMRAGVQRGVEGDLRRLEEQLLGTRISAKTSLMQDLMNYMERRQPSITDILNMASGAVDIGGYFGGLV